MSAPINPPDLDTALKSLWGASQLPFGAAVEKPYASDTFKETRRRLEQLVAVRACGLLHGPNGVGKTLLVRTLSEPPPHSFRTRTAPSSHLLRTLFAPSALTHSRGFWRWFGFGVALEGSGIAGLLAVARLESLERLETVFIGFVLVHDGLFGTALVRRGAHGRWPRLRIKAYGRTTSFAGDEGKQ